VYPNWSEINLLEFLLFLKNILFNFILIYRQFYIFTKTSTTTTISLAPATFNYNLKIFNVMVNVSFLFRCDFLLHGKCKVPCGRRLVFVRPVLCDMYN
jgi:hypothetical protein